MANKSELIGLKEANAALRRLPDFAKAEAQQTMDVTAFQVARLAAAKAPYKSGTLRNGIAWESRPRSLSAVVGRSKAAWYWRLVEFGTRFQAARPFIRPVLDEMRADHDRRLRQALEKAANHVEREAKR